MGNYKKPLSEEQELIFETRLKMRQTKEYATWQNMKQRCLNKNNKSYSDYGGKGITVSEEWINSFETFLEGMGIAPTPSHSIDRINGRLGYSRENCRWATKTEQVENRSTTRWITFNGETHTCSEWGRIIGGGRTTVGRRLRAGWTEAKAVSTPVGKYKKEESNMDKKIGFLDHFNRVVAFSEDRDTLDRESTLRATTDLDIEIYYIESEGIRIESFESLDEAIVYVKNVDCNAVIVAVEA